MDIKDFKTIASQLKKPTGDLGTEVGKMMNNGNRLMNQAAINSLNPEANDNILEIGMGNGFFVRDILERDNSIRYTGCDFSEIMIREAILNNRQYVRTGRAEFTLADVIRLPFTKQSFNKILTVNTIYFWDHVEKALTEIKRVLTQNGELIISLRPKSVMDILPLTQYGFKTFSKQNCIDLLANAGFKNIRVEESEDNDIELSGIKFKNAYMLVKAAKES